MSGAASRRPRAGSMVPHYSAVLCDQGEEVVTGFGNRVIGTPVFRQFACHSGFQKRAAEGIEALSCHRQRRFALGDLGEQSIDPRDDAALFGERRERNGLDATANAAQAREWRSYCSVCATGEILGTNQYQRYRWHRYRTQNSGVERQTRLSRIKNGTH